MDRVAIAWTGAQLDLIGELAMKGKRMAVIQMGGGQLDVGIPYPQLRLGNQVFHIIKICAKLTSSSTELSNRQ